MAELAHGRFVTLDDANKLGILSSADALMRPSVNGPWEAAVPADRPVDEDEDAGDTKDKDQPPMTSKNISLHRALHKMNTGGLHRALGVPEGENIPADKLASAMNSDNPHIKHMALFAHTLQGFHKK